ncbi:MAG TPA: DnaB-like helicase C-terminal domain-containing protein, partial [Solirubrobacterales bacterium]
MSRLALMPDDGPEFEVDPTTESPAGLARMQAAEARQFLEEIRAGKGLRFPWTDLDRLVGPLLPGWFVAVGGRAKAGKTSLMLELLTAWTELGKVVVYVGTETEVAMLKYQWAAVRCNVPIDTAIDPDCPRDIYDRLMRDVEETQARPDLAYRAIFADAPDATMGALAAWVGYGRDHQADALIFDHLSQLEVAPGERWQHLGDAIHQIKKLARN